ncbi:type 1 fimbrial protein [Yersinia enterocolitica]|nr:type 1 fimbrial protein [Yersinia enterocolitica]
MCKRNKDIIKDGGNLRTKIATIVCFAFSVLSTSPQAAAEDGTITFTGAVSAVTCKITGGTEAGSAGTNDFTVPLKTVSTSALSSVGQRAQATKFYIALTGAECTDGAKANVNFERARDTIDDSTGNLKNSAVDAAANVQISILNKDTTPLNLAVANDKHQEETISGNSARFDYWAEYVATGVVTAGNVESSLIYSIVYN